MRTENEIIVEDLKDDDVEANDEQAIYVHGSVTASRNCRIVLTPIGHNQKASTSDFQAVADELEFDSDDGERTDEVTINGRRYLCLMQADDDAYGDGDDVVWDFRAHSW